MAIHPDTPQADQKTVSNIVTPDGTAATYPTLVLTPEDARLLREYKKFLQRHRYREALFCNDCWEGHLSDGTEAHVTPNAILIRCRCRATTFMGPTF